MNKHSKPTDSPAPQAKEIQFPVNMTLRMVVSTGPSLRAEIVARLADLFPSLQSEDIIEKPSGKYLVYHIPLTVDTREQFDGIYQAFAGDPRVLWMT